MKKSLKVILAIVFILIIVFAVISKNKNKNKALDLLSCSKQDNCCLQNEDCRSTDHGCFTKEQFAKESKLAAKRGLNQLSLGTINICTCKSNKCTTKN